MTYDADGLRSTKTVGTRKFEYQYVGDKLFYEKRGDNQEFYYFYDSYGNLSMIYYTLVGSNGVTSRAVYHAVTNAQGDVIALHKQNGQLVARYEYDAWGNTLSVTDANGNPITTWYNIANSNPIRYRGYYYDSDIGLYYLQSRYYDAEIGRFINADGYITTGHGVMSYNMYSYCQNNPVMYSDPSGKSLTGLFIAYFISMLAIVVGGSYCAATVKNPPYKPDKIPDNSDVVDISEKLDDAMKDNAQELKDYSNEHNFIDTTLYFVDKVKPGGDWDFKAQEEWTLNSSTTYSYNGLTLRYDDIGNIHYGYVGRVLFEESTLLRAGGMVQIYTHTSRWYFCNSNFDDQHDQWAIGYGSFLWDEGGV